MDTLIEHLAETQKLVLLWNLYLSPSVDVPIHKK